MHLAKSHESECSNQVEAYKQETVGILAMGRRGSNVQVKWRLTSKTVDIPAIHRTKRSVVDSIPFLKQTLSRVKPYYHSYMGLLNPTNPEKACFQQQVFPAMC